MLEEHPADLAYHVRVLKTEMVGPHHDLGPGTAEPGAGEGHDPIGRALDCRITEGRDDGVERDSCGGTGPFQVGEYCVIPGELIDARHRGVPRRG
jgi:hypothetical protein